MSQDRPLGPSTELATLTHLSKRVRTDNDHQPILDRQDCINNRTGNLDAHIRGSDYRKPNTAGHNHEASLAATLTRTTSSEEYAKRRSSGQEPTSTYGLVDRVSFHYRSQYRNVLTKSQLFQKYDAVSELTTNADALPGQSPDQNSSTRNNQFLAPVSDLIGETLPAPEVINLLLETFIDSVHWFMMVFHEPTLRGELQTIVTTGQVQIHRLSFLILILVILSIGAIYVRDDLVQLRCPGQDMTRLQIRLLRKVEEKFLDVFDEGDIESVQVCILLGSIYIYHRRPKRAFVVLGAALKASHANGLHRESLWGQVTDVTREVRRRVWLALYVYDG